MSLKPKSMQVVEKKRVALRLFVIKEEARKHAHEMFGKTLVTHQTGPSGQVVMRVHIE